MVDGIHFALEEVKELDAVVRDTQRRKGVNGAEQVVHGVILLVADDSGIILCLGG